MPAGDVWFCRCDMSTFQRGHGFGFYVLNLLSGPDDTDGDVLAEALNSHFTSLLTAFISSETRVEGWRCWQKRGSGATPGQFFVQGGTGNRGANPIPLNNSVRIHFEQELFDARYNNGISIGAIDELDTDGSYLTAGLQTLTQLFANKFLEEIPPAGGGAEIWEAVNVAKRLPLNPPGDVSTIVRVKRNERVMSMAPRTTRVVGTADATG